MRNRPARTLLSIAAIATMAMPGVAQARHGADDPAGHVRHASHARHHASHHVRHRARHGADDGARHARHGADDGARHARHGADDGANHT